MVVNVIAQTFRPVRASNARGADNRKAVNPEEKSRGNNAVELSADSIAVYTVLRFAIYARKYYQQLYAIAGKDPSKEVLADLVRQAVLHYIEKRIRKECDLSYARKEIGVISNLLVWGGALISNALSVLSSAPIKLLASWSSVNLEPILCVWFYLSGCLIGVSVDTAKKFLARLWRFILEANLKQLSIVLEDRVFRFRLFIVAATGLSSCYFSMFGIMRLVKSPQDYGAEIVINMLFKQCLPLLWPVIVPVWVLLTVVAAMMSLYKESKFYAICMHRARSMMVFIRADRQKRQSMQLAIVHWLSKQWHYKNFKKLCKSGFIALTALAVTLTYHVTVMKLTGSLVFSVMLSVCVFLMNFAKFSMLYQKVKQLGNRCYQDVVYLFKNHHWQIVGNTDPYALTVKQTEVPINTHAGVGDNKATKGSTATEQKPKFTEVGKGFQYIRGVQDLLCQDEIDGRTRGHTF